MAYSKGQEAARRSRAEENLTRLNWVADELGVELLWASGDTRFLQDLLGPWAESNGNMRVIWPLSSVVFPMELQRDLADQAKLWEAVHEVLHAAWPKRPENADDLGMFIGVEYLLVKRLRVPRCSWMSELRGVFEIRPADEKLLRAKYGRRLYSSFLRHSEVHMLRYLLEDRIEQAIDYRILTPLRGFSLLAQTTVERRASYRKLKANDE